MLSPLSSMSSGGEVLAEEWEREVSKLFPHDWLSLRGWGLRRLCHRGRPSPILPRRRVLKRRLRQ